MPVVRTIEPAVEVSEMPFASLKVELAVTEIAPPVVKESEVGAPPIVSGLPPVPVNDVPEAKDAPLP